MDDATEIVDLALKNHYNMIKEFKGIFFKYSQLIKQNFMELNKFKLWQLCMEELYTVKEIF